MSAPCADVTGINGEEAF